MGDHGDPALNCGAGGPFNSAADCTGNDATGNACVFKAAAGTDNFPQPTASVIAGENGAGAYQHGYCSSPNGDGTCEPFSASEALCTVASITPSAARTDGDATTCVWTGAGDGDMEMGPAAVTLGNMMEHAEKYAYIGKGYDKLTVSPMPDSMNAQKVNITYSGRGNCDFTTGTCLCDAGYTLEACSEQTVLV